jgi:hypothetical protein
MIFLRELLPVQGADPRNKHQPLIDKHLHLQHFGFLSFWRWQGFQAIFFAKA